MANVLVGIFVGGKSSRMGGLPKGLLRPPSGEASIIERWTNLLRDEGLPWVLVGRVAGYEGWANATFSSPRSRSPSRSRKLSGRLGSGIGSGSGRDGTLMIDDDPPGIGPIGGLHALAKRAGGGAIVALGCDMPHVGAQLLRKLILAPAGPAVAPRNSGTWEPLFARYDARTMIEILPSRIAQEEHSLQSLLNAVGAAELALAESELAELADWDSPGDMEAK